MPPPAPPMNPLSHLFGPLPLGDNATGPMLPLKLIPWGPLDNNGRGSRPGQKVHGLRKVKIYKSLRQLMGGKITTPEFDYGVTYNKPKRAPKPMSPKKHQIVSGYNVDGSLRIAPTVLPVPQVAPSLSDTNSFVYNPPCYECDGEKFILFPKLPGEIRKKIWNFAIPSDRIVKIYRRDQTTSLLNPIPHVNGEKRGSFVVCTAYPGLLGACTESRKIGFETYKLAFGHRLDGRAIYFDFSRDVLFFVDTETLHTFTGCVHDFEYGEYKLTGDLLAVQRMIVCNGIKRVTIHILGLYENLKSVTFQEQEFRTGRGQRRAVNREARAMSDLWKRKKDGGSGLAGCRVSFETKQLLQFVSGSIVWRKGMLDNGGR